MSQSWQYLGPLVRVDAELERPLAAERAQMPDVRRFQVEDGIEPGPQVRRVHALAGEVIFVREDEIGLLAVDRGSENLQRIGLEHIVCVERDHESSRRTCEALAHRALDAGVLGTRKALDSMVGRDAIEHPHDVVAYRAVLEHDPFEVGMALLEKRARGQLEELCWRAGVDARQDRERHLRGGPRQDGARHPVGFEHLCVRQRRSRVAERPPAHLD